MGTPVERGAQSGAQVLQEGLASPADHTCWQVPEGPNLALSLQVLKDNPICHCILGRVQAVSKDTKVLTQPLCHQDPHSPWDTTRLGRAP